MAESKKQIGVSNLVNVHEPNDRKPGSQMDLSRSLKDESSDTVGLLTSY